MTTATAAPMPSPSLPPSQRDLPKNPPRKLCAGELEGPSRDFPNKSVSRVAAKGASEIPAQLAVGGAWTWINFWAAWCVPCKEEMPRLMGWEKKLAAGEASRSSSSSSLSTTIGVSWTNS